MSETITNPYSAPDAPIDTPTPRMNQSGAPFRFTEVWKLAWEALKAHWFYGSLAFLIVFLLLAVVMVVSIMAASPLNPSYQNPSFAGAMVMHLIQTVLQAPLTMGMAWLAYVAVFARRNAVTQPFSVGLIGKGFEMIGPAVLIGLLLQLIFLLAALPGAAGAGFLAQALADSDPLAVAEALLTGKYAELSSLVRDTSALYAVYATAFILIAVPTLYLATRLMFTYYACLEKKLSAPDSLKASWALTEGQVLRLVMFGLAVILIFVLTAPVLAIGIVLTCFLGFAPFMFFVSNINAALYYYITRGEDEKS